MPVLGRLCAWKELCRRRVTEELHLEHRPGRVAPVEETIERLDSRIADEFEKVLRELDMDAEEFIEWRRV